MNKKIFIYYLIQFIISIIILEVIKEYNLGKNIIFIVGFSLGCVSTNLLDYFNNK